MDLPEPAPGSPPRLHATLDHLAAIEDAREPYRVASSVAGGAVSGRVRHPAATARSARLTGHGHRANKRHGLAYRARQVVKDGCFNPASPPQSDGPRRAVAKMPHCSRGNNSAAVWR